MSTEKIRYLSLFSGIGGFEYGLEQSKYEFENVGWSEIDKYARSIYIRHFPRHRDLGDASEIDTSELQDFELLVGGFPCQAFSLSGKREGFDDTRGTLFFEIARILKDCRPKYFLLENVKGLLSHDGGRTFKKMLGILSELGYDVEWQIFNSKSFGTAQNRERLYIKGYSRAKCGREILSVRRSYREIGFSRKELNSSQGKPKPVHFNRQVKKRIHSVDYGELSNFLKSAKKSAKLTINDIAEKLDKPRSEVEHWFRADKYFAPPSDDIWFDLKQLLGIETDTYDAFITEYEWVDGVYEMDKRAYDEDGLSPTLTTTETLAKINVVADTSPTGHWGGDVYGEDGLSRTLTQTNYKHPLKVLDVKKVYGSTQKHRAETDGSYVPTLTEAMGKGGGHIPMLELKESDERKIQRVGTTNGYQSGEVYGVDGVSPTLCGFDKAKAITKIHEPLKVKTNTKKGYDEIRDGDGLRLAHPTSKKVRGRSQKGMTGALSTGPDWGTVDKEYRIRRLTPRECERLQAFPDDYTLYGKDGEVISDTQRYRCLGNAVTTSVVTWIMDNYFFGETR